LGSPEEGILEKDGERKMISPGEMGRNGGKSAWAGDESASSICLLREPGYRGNVRAVTRGNMSDRWKPVDARGFCSGTMAGHGVTILVIDDHDAVLDMLEEGLTASGYAVLKASSGKEGLRLFKENPVDAILCDLGMPHMDGWEVAAAITEACDRQGRGKPPLILVTAWAGQIDGDARISRLGIEAVLGKPVTMDALIRTVELEINKRRQEPAGS